MAINDNSNDAEAIGGAAFKGLVLNDKGELVEANPVSNTPEPSNSGGMSRRNFVRSMGLLAGATAIGSFAASCKKDEIHKEEIVKIPGAGEPEVTTTEITVGRVGVHYQPLSVLKNNVEAFKAALNDNKVIVQPGHMGFGSDIEKNGAAAAKDLPNAAGYMSGIALDKDDAALGPLRDAISKIGPDGKDGWLRDASGNKVPTTFTKGALKEVYMVDLRKPWVAKAMTEYGIRVGKSFPKGAILDEPDQAIYYEDVNPTVFGGLTQAFAQMHNDIATAVYHGFGINEVYKNDASGQPTRRNVMYIENGVAKNREEPNATYTPTYHPIDILSGIQPSEKNLSGQILARYVGASGCSLTLESRVYLKGGKGTFEKTDSTYRGIVKQQIVQLAQAAKAAGRTGISINVLEPGEDNTLDGFERAAIETATFYRDVVKSIEAETGLKVAINMNISKTVPGVGYFDFNDPESFTMNDQLKTRLQGKDISGIKISNVSQNPSLSVNVLNAETTATAPVVDVEQINDDVKIRRVSAVGRNYVETGAALQR